LTLENWREILKKLKILKYFFRMFSGESGTIPNTRCCFRRSRKIKLPKSWRITPTTSVYLATRSTLTR
jgi:hypothetical protein